MAIFSDAAWREMSDALWYARGVVESTYREVFKREVVITSGRRDPSPGGSSRHGTGDAMDIRSKDLSRDQEAILAAKLRERLGEDFDVIVEGEFSPDPQHRNRVRHIHIEYDPKGRHLTD